MKKTWMPTMRSVAARIAAAPPRGRRARARSSGRRSRPRPRVPATISASPSTSPCSSRSRPPSRSSQRSRVAELRDGVGAAAEAEAEQLRPDDHEQRAADQRVDEVAASEEARRAQTRAPSGRRRAASQDRPGHEEQEARVVERASGAGAANRRGTATASTRPRAGAARSAARGSRAAPRAARITISEANSIPVDPSARRGSTAPHARACRNARRRPACGRGG